MGYFYDRTDLLKTNHNTNTRSELLRLELTFLAIKKVASRITASPAAKVWTRDGTDQALAMKRSPERAMPTG